MSDNTEQQPKSTLYDVYLSITKILNSSKFLTLHSNDPSFQHQLVFDMNMNFVSYLYERSQPQHYNSFFGVNQTNHGALGISEYEITRVISSDIILTKQGQDTLSNSIGNIRNIILEQIPLDSPDWIKLVKTFPQLKNYTSPVHESII